MLTDPTEALSDLQSLGAEEIVYRPSGGTARKVWALVKREDVEAVQGSRVTTKAIEVTVVADATLGIVPATAREGDVVVLSLDLGGDPVDRQLSRCFKQAGVIAHFRTK